MAEAFRISGRLLLVPPGVVYSLCQVCEINSAECGLLAAARPPTDPTIVRRQVIWMELESALIRCLARSRLKSRGVLLGP